MASPYDTVAAQNRIEYARACGPVLAALAAAGHPLTDLQELVRRKPLPKSAVPILIEWLPRLVDVNVKETIVRALSDRSAKPAAARALVTEFAATREDKSLKWAIGNALSVVADDSVFDDLRGFVADATHGKAREMIAVALGNVKDSRSRGVLLGLLEDEQLAGHAIMGLARLADPTTRGYISPFLKDRKPWVRREAAKALAKLDRAGH